MAVAVSSAHDKRGLATTVLTAEPLAGTLRLTADYMGMRFGGQLLGYANRPGEIQADADGLARARAFFS